MSILNLILAALAPVVAIIVYIYAKDKHEKEPRRLMFYTFLFGAFLSIFITTVLYVIFDYILPINKDTVLQQFIKAFLIVGLTEEFSKYIIVRYYSQRRSEFNEPFDGIVYAVMVSMGFAATENILYVLEGGYEVALLRAFTAIPAHATFAVIMGFFMGRAKFSKNRIKWNLIGLLGAIIFHGAYDFFLFIHFIPGIWVGAFASLILGLFLSLKAIKIHQEGSFFKNT